MPKICPSCSAESLDHFRFCGLCGASLEATPPIPAAGESGAEERSSRRWVTILFADLTNFTRVAERADPEAVYLTIRRALESLSQPVKRLGGRLDRFVGDGFLATFGLPEAHEDDPTRALLAAFEMQDFMVGLRAEASQNLGWDVQLRVGINIGSVISGQVDTGSLLDASVFGHAVNVAKRLQESARPGTILVSQALQRLTHARFNFLEPVRMHLKGIDGPVIGYEVTGHRSDPGSSRGLSGRTTPLVGRNAECEALNAGLQRMKIDRRGMIALVTGEAGIGKSRLVDEVLAPLSDHVTVVRAECSPNQPGIYGLLASLLENMAGITLGAPPSVRQERLENLLSVSDTLAREVGPVLQGLVGAQASEDRLAGDPQQQQRRVYAAIRQLLAWLARRRAMVLVLDDLQWADPSSLEVLSHAADLVQETPLAIIAVARSSAREALPSAFTRADAAHPDSFLDVSLSALSPDESDHLVTLLLREVTLPPALKQIIVERTSGNPLLVEETVRMLLDRELIRETPAGWQVEPGWRDAVQDVPDTVNGLILSRYDRLSADLRHILDAAAALGPSFSLPLLASMTRVEEPELRLHLGSLEQADFIRRSSGTGVPEYFFRHALMQEAIYQTILQKERRALHLQAAHIIQQMSGSLAVDSAAIVGHHFEMAKSSQAVRYLIQAAGRAADRYANQEAVAFYTRAEALLAEHGARQDQVVDVALGLCELLTRMDRPEAAGEQLERARLLSSGPPIPGYRRGDIYYRLGFVHNLQGAHTEALAALETAVVTLREDPAQCQLFSLSDIQRDIGWIMCDQAKLTEARQRAEEALALAQQQSDLAATGSAHNLLSAVHYYAGRLPDSVASARAALAIREQMGDVWGSASTQTNLGTLYHKLGQWAQAESFLRQAIFVQQEIGDHYTLSLSWNALGLLLLESGRFEEAIQCLTQAITDLSDRERPPALASLLYCNRGLVWLRQGDVGRAISDIETGLDAAIRLKNDYHRAIALSLLAEARLANNELERAHELILQAMSASEASGSPETQAEILRVNSHILAAGKNWADALTASSKAREVFSKIGNRYEVARRQIDAAEILLSWQQDDGKVEPELSLRGDVLEALKTFRDLNAQADIPRAEDLLVKVSSRFRPAGGEAAGARQQPVVVVHLRLHLPQVTGRNQEQHEGLVDALNSLSAALRKVGREHGAVVTSGDSSLAFVVGAHEPDEAGRLALRAIQSALAAADAGMRLGRSSRRRYGLEIPLTIGIAAGRWQEAVDDPQEASVFVSVSQIGRQSAAAAALASASQIILTTQVARSARAVYELDAIEETGDPRLPEPVYRLGRAKSDAHLPQVLPASSPQLVGRDAEMAALTGWIDRLPAEPRGRVCYLEAEAGMGKTRLLDELMAYSRPKIVCLLGKCESYRSGISYWPLIDMLENEPSSETPASQRLRSLLGLRPPDEADDTLLHSLPASALRQELFGCVREFLIEQAGQRPCLLAVEDVHWLDLSSLDLLDFLLPLALEAPISIMLVARAEMPGPHRALVSKAERVCQDRFLRVRFSTLPASDSITLIHNVLATQSVPANLWKLLAPFAGHPLSLEEGLRFLVERGWLWQTEGQWRLAEIEHSVDRRMPGNFKDLLLGRLDILEDETLHVLQAAAVLGETFDRTVLGRIVPGPNLSSRLTELTERGWLLAAKPDNSWLYRFKHTLTRETIYATLLASKRQVLHQRAGEAIEYLYPETLEENLELLAYHFSHTSLRDKSLHYLVRAAEKSASRHALAEGLGFYQQAREMHERNPYLQPKLASTIALGLADVHLALGEPASVIADIAPVLDKGRLDLDSGLHAACLRRLGAARRRMGDFPAALKHCQAALEMLLALKQAHLPASRATLDSNNREFLTVEVDVAYTMFDMHNNPPAREQAERVLDSLDRRQHPEIAAEALNLLGGLAYREGDLASASRLVQESLLIYQTDGNRSGAASAYANLGLLAAMRQEPDTAHDYMALSLEIHAALGNGTGVSVTRNNLGQLERNRGRHADAIHHLRAGIDSARRAELAHLLAQGLANLGEVLRLVDRTSEALGALDEAETLCHRHDFRDLMCEVSWRRADCLCDECQLARAADVAQSAVSLAVELDSSDLESEARRALGRACRKIGRIDAALEASAAAWQARENDADPALRARFAAEYALALKASGRATEADQLLAQHVKSVKLQESSAALEEISEALAGLDGRV